MSKKEKDFKFFLPIDLVKAEKDQEDDAMSWRIQGIASTPDEDLQGESVDQNGLDISVLKTGRGLFNDNHGANPQDIIGEIEDADFVDQDGKKCLFVKGYLFKHQDKAKAYYNILKSLKKTSHGRIQMSIEGKILQRDLYDSKSIKKARITRIALCTDPVNPNTYAELVKSLNAPDAELADITNEIQPEMVTIQKSELEKLIDFAQKALAAGTGYAGAPGTMSGGAALSAESLDHKEHKVTYGKKEKLSRYKLKLVKKSLQELYPDQDTLKLAELVLEALISKTLIED